MKTWIGTEAALTADLTAEEFGAYERLRRYYWLHQGLPDDDRRLMRIAGVDADRWDDVRSAICGLFSEGWRLPNLDMERGDAMDKRERKIAAGKKGADKRWGSKTNAPANSKSIAEPMAELMAVPMAEAMEGQCGPNSHQHQHQTTYAEDERLSPTHGHAREAALGPVYLDPPENESDGRAWLTRRGLGPKGMSQALHRLMGGRLSEEMLDQILVTTGAS